MKKLLIFTFLIILVQIVSAQKIYVEPTSEGIEQPIIDKLLKLKKNIVTNQENSDFTIKCVILSPGKLKAEGNVEIYDTKTNKMLARSKLVSARLTAFHGYSSTEIVVMKKIAKDYLYKVLFEAEKAKK
jgi:hypothetical protein